MNKRIEWVDYSKAIGIFLIVLGHTQISNSIKGYFYSFHVPIFFFLSGYLFTIKNKNLKDQLEKKIFKIYVPYSIFYLSIYLLFIIKNLIKNENINYFKPLLGMVYSRPEYMLDMTGQLWFLTCLLLVELIGYIIITNISNDKLILFIAIIFSSFGYLYGLFFNEIKLPWSLDVAFVSVIFYISGYLYKKYESSNKKMNVPTVITIFFINIVCTVYNGKIDMFDSKYGNYILFLIGAFTGICLCIYVSKLIKDVKIMQYVGQNSIVILIYHGLIFRLIDVILKRFLHIQSLYFVKNIWVGIDYTLITIIISIPLIKMLNRYTPFVVGRKK